MRERGKLKVCLQCQYRLMDCPNKTAYGAISEWEGSKAQLEEHLESCGGATVQCPRPACGISLARRQLHLHEEKCARFRCVAATGGRNAS